MQFKINEATLENKLKVFHMEVPSDDITVLANVNAGSLYETKSNAGISHLIEHMIFKGTSKRPSRDFIYNEFMKLIGTDWICYTDKTNIPLGLRVTLDDFEYALEFISDLLFNSIFDEKEINKEKLIVLDEIRYRHDDPSMHLHGSFGEALYKGCKLEKSILGSEETIKPLTRNQVFNFYKKMFNPANTALFIVGPKGFNEVVDKVQNLFAKDIEIGKSYYILKIRIPENKAKKIILKKDCENVHLMMGRIVPSSQHKDSHALSVLGSALSRAVSNKILNEEPISYDRYVMYYAMRFAGELAVYASCNPLKYKRVKELIEGEFLKYSKGEISSYYIEDAIISHKKRFILNDVSTLNKAETLLNFWLRGNIYDINSHLEKLENLTVQEVRNAGKKYVCLDDLTEVVIGNI